MASLLRMVSMKDVIMIAVLLVCFGSVKLLADWCEHQFHEE